MNDQVNQEQAAAPEENQAPVQPQPQEQVQAQVQPSMINQGFANMDESDKVGFAHQEHHGTPEALTMENYQFQYPEGLDEESIGKELMDEFREDCSKRGLTPEQAQMKLNEQIHWQSRVQSRQADLYTQQDYKEWTSESQQMGLLEQGPQEEANYGLSLTDPYGEVRRILKSTGLTTNPSIIQAYRALGRQNSQDRGTSPVTSVPVGTQELSQEQRADRLFQPVKYNRE